MTVAPDKEVTEWSKTEAQIYVSVICTIFVIYYTYTRKEKSLVNTGEVSNVYKFLNREGGKRSLQTLKRKWVKNINLKSPN